MRTLVLGGIRSGKSRWAESALADRVQQSAPADRVHSSASAGAPAVRYLATGGRTPADEEWTRRVARHRERRPQHWHTVESDAVAAELRDDPHTPTLVDDIGGWLTATLDRRGWDGRPADGEIDDSHHLTGAPPRAPDAPELLNAQAALLQQLMRAHS